MTTSIHLACYGTQYGDERDSRGQRIITSIAEPKVMLCGLGWPLKEPLAVAVPFDHPSLCPSCKEKWASKRGGVRPMLYQ